MEFTFIFILYNLDPLWAYGVTDNDIRYREIEDQLLRMPLSLKANYVLIDHKTERTQDLNVPYKNTKIRYITKKNEFENEIKEPSEYTFGVRNIGDGDSWAGIFLLTKEKFQAEKYVIFTYNHSNFTGHLTSRIRLEDLIKVLANYKIDIGVEKTGAHAEILLDGKKADPGDEEVRILFPDFRNPESYDMLTNAEFANALYTAFVLNGTVNEKQERRVEAVFFDTCYTAAIDNLYLYAESCKHIIATEGIINYNSFSIENILNRFYSSSSTGEVLNETIRNFEADFKTLLHHAGSSDYEKAIIGVFKFSTEYRKSFRRIFNSLILDLIADIEFLADYISKRINQLTFWKDCFYIYNSHNPDPAKQEFDTHCIDFISFFEDLQKNTKAKPYNYKITDLLAFIKDSIGEIYFGSKTEKDRFKGISLFFNRDVLTLNEKKKKEIDHSYSFYSLFQNDFAKDTYWPEFIQLYQKKTARYYK